MWQLFQELVQYNKLHIYYFDINIIVILFAWFVLPNAAVKTRFTLQWRHNEHDSVSHDQHHGCLLNRLFRRRSKKTSKLRVTGLCVGNSPGPVNSPHKGPVTRKMFPFDDVIMLIKLSITPRVCDFKLGNQRLNYTKWDWKCITTVAVLCGLWFRQVVCLRHTDES